jgi:hypothetical protein
MHCSRQRQEFRQFPHFALPPLSHFWVHSPERQMHALPAKIVLSGIPGISGRERGVAQPPMDWGRQRLLAR